MSSCCDKLLVLALLQKSWSVADVIADDVVEVPHRCRWAVEAFLLQKRIELVLLTGIVHGILSQLVI